MDWRVVLLAFLGTVAADKGNASEVRGQLTKTKRFLTWHQSFNGTVGTRK